MFEQSVVETRGTSKPWTLLAMTGQVVAAGLAMTVPMTFPEVLNVARRLAPIEFRLPDLPPVVTRQAASASSVPSSGGMTMTARATRVFRAPSSVVPIESILLDPGSSDHIVLAREVGLGFGPGIPGATGSGVITVGPPAPAMPVAPKVVERVVLAKPVPIGGKVLEAKKISQLLPVYPQIAKVGRIQGMVRLEGVIARDGTIQKLRVVSGHPLLVQSALDAVKQWRYSPTLLNGEPVEVIAPIDVNFILSN